MNDKKREGTHICLSSFLNKYVKVCKKCIKNHHNVIINTGLIMLPVRGNISTVTDMWIINLIII